MPPKIIAVYLGLHTGQPGEPIYIIARDDFEVKEVVVVVRRVDRVEIERGEAVPCAGDVFRYETKTAMPAGTEPQIEVIARDWPGNHTHWHWPPAAPGDGGH